MCIRDSNYGSEHKFVHCSTCIVQEVGAKNDGITKQGYLMKGPEVGSDRMFVNIGSKSFKRRYCYLR